MGRYGNSCPLECALYEKDVNRCKSPDVMGYKDFPNFPHRQNTHFPISAFTPTIAPTHHPSKMIIPICNPPPCYIYVVSSGPLRLRFTIFKLTFTHGSIIQYLLLLSSKAARKQVSGMLTSSNRLLTLPITTSHTYTGKNQHFIERTHHGGILAM